jgi:FeS assembly SUF system protein
MNEETKAMTENTADTQSCAPAPDEKAASAPVAHAVPEEEAAKSSIPAEELNRMTNDIITAIKTVYDPEIPVDIFELGLIYKIDISDDRIITIDMTLTAPGCPVAGEMPVWVQNAVSPVEGVQDVKVEMVFDPPWDMSRMSEEAQVALNMY